MTDYRNYSIEDLLLDNSFVHYCLNADHLAVEQWETWLLANPDQQAKLSAARKLLFSLGVRLSTEDKQIEFDKLKAAVSAYQQTGSLTTIKPSGSRLMLRWIAGAAAACLFLFAGYQWRNWSGFSSSSRSQLAYEIIHSGTAERKLVELNDGSTVLLNSNSRLKIPLDYNGKERALQLEGEALFDVAHQPQKPFFVNTENARVEALGTVFKVRSYGFEPSIQTSLLKGKVKIDQLNRENTTVFLLPGQQLTRNRSAENSSTGSFDIGLEEQWRRGQLIFRNASLEQIREMLQYWYGMEVRLQGQPAKTIRFNGEFNNKELKDVMTAIAYVNNLRYTIHENQITIISR